MNKSIKISGKILSRYNEIISDEALQFVQEIHEQFNNTRLELLNERKKRQKEIKYSVDSWKGNFYIHTNLDAEDYKICKCKHENINEWQEYIPATNGVLIGGFTLLNDWMVRSEVRDALSKLYVRNLSTNKEEELTILATGSEVNLASEVSHKLATENTHSKVISVPCQELFDEQKDSYRKKTNTKSIEESKICF